MNNMHVLRVLAVIGARLALEECWNAVDRALYKQSVNACKNFPVRAAYVSANGFHSALWLCYIYPDI